MERLASARDSIHVQSNRFLVAGMVFAILYAVKAIGLRIDLVLFDTKVFELPYGLFVFCVLGAGSFLIAQTRFMDAHAISRRMNVIADAFARDKAEQYLRSFPAKSSWLSLAQEEFFATTGGTDSRGAWLVNVAGLGLLAVYLLPVFSCIHFLLNWPDLANGEMPRFQWWVVAGGLGLDGLFLILLIRLHKV